MMNSGAHRDEREDEREKSALEDAVEELGGGKKVLRTLAAAKIATIADLFRHRDDLREKTFKGLSELSHFQEPLYYLSLWHEDFYKNHDEKNAWVDSFTSEKLSKFVDELAQIPKLFEHARSMIHDGRPGDLSDISPKMLQGLYDHVVSRVKSKLPKELLTKQCHFDVEERIKKTAVALLNLPTGKPYSKIPLIAGRTQSGKSSLKAVVKATCEELNVPVIVVTKGLAESKDLDKKITSLLNQGKDDFEAWWGASSESNRITVINDTGYRINGTAIPLVNTLRKMKPHGKFVVIVDESDAMYRTDKNKQDRQKFELAFDDLMDLNPALRIEVSATPIPTLLVLRDQGYQLEIENLGTSDDYCGVDEMVCLKDKDNNDIFLEPVSLKPKTGLPYENENHSWGQEIDEKPLFVDEPKEDWTNEFDDEGLDFIPCTDESVMQLYNDAFLNSNHGVLLLDCTICRVSVDLNIFQKAACVQNFFMAQGKKSVIVVVVGSGIYIRRPGFLCGRKIPNCKTIFDVLDQLDKEFALDMPFLVFGYSKMRRCVSIRSHLRVPTHMVIILGFGQSDESYIQALGRATFNGLKTTLYKNGFQHVTVLTTETDLKMAQKYNNFVQEAGKLLEQNPNDKMQEKIAGDAKRVFGAEANYPSHTNRKTGQIKGLKDRLPTQDEFEVPETVDVHDKNTIAHGVMMAILDLVHEHRDTQGDVIASRIILDDPEAEDGRTAEKKWNEINKQGFAVSEIKKKYNDTHQENGFEIILSPQLRKELTKLKAKAKLEQREDGRWRAKNLEILRKECSYEPEPLSAADIDGGISDDGSAEDKGDEYDCDYDPDHDSDSSDKASGDDDDGGDFDDDEDDTNELACPHFVKHGLKRARVNAGSSNYF